MSNPVLRDKIKGMILGVAIGDALGMPVEGHTADEAEAFFDHYSENKENPQSTYRVNRNHHWFKTRESGTWTDDTQLTLATAEGIISALSSNKTSCEGIMDCIAQAHVDSLDRFGNLGLGSTTREAIEALKSGVSWESSASIGRKLGYGNGVVMKISPIAALLSTTRAGGIALIEKLTNMSHKREVSVSASYAMAEALNYCLKTNYSEFLVTDFIKGIVSASLAGWDNINARYQCLLMSRLVELGNYSAYNRYRIIEEFGEGRVPVYDSLPFSLMFFVKGMASYPFDTIMDCIKAGGDTDSNGSMVASLFGALLGSKIWTEPYIEYLWQKDYILDVIERFCYVLRI